MGNQAIAKCESEVENAQSLGNMIWVLFKSATNFLVGAV
ncbi:MAG: hypothetical protein RLZZ144_10 [Pseudomonadota bacterium]|jgi:hypothetical protein